MTKINFTDVEPLIKSTYTIDELIEMFNEMLDVYNTIVYKFNDSNYGHCLCSVSVEYICNAVVMYHTLELFQQTHGYWALDTEYWRALDTTLDNVFRQMVNQRREMDDRTTTVVEQLIAGAGIDFAERIINDFTAEDCPIYPIRGDSRIADVVSYGVDAVLDYDHDNIYASSTKGIRKWLLDRIKQFNPNFTLNFTWK